MSQQFCLKWNNHTTNMLQVFENLLTTEALVDVTLACDGLSLKAHKMVLSACSPFFQSLFLENPCKHPIVIMKDMRYCDLKAIIDFMYRGEVNVSHDQLSALLKTAETLKVKGLAEVTGENKQASGIVQQEIVQNSSSPTPVPPSAQRTDTPPLQGKRKRGRPRKRSLSDSNRSDDEGVPPKIKETNSDVEELSGDASMEATSDNRSGGGPISCNSQSQVPIHSSNNVNNFSKSHLSTSQDPQVDEEPVSGDENEFEVEPSKLLEQTLTTENVPSNSQNSTGPITLPSVSGLEISRRSMSSTDSVSQALVPVSIPSDSLGSNLQGPDSPQDIKPQILSFDDPPISPVAGTSHGSDRSLMMYMDQSGVASIPGPSNFQDNSALVPHDSQPQDEPEINTTSRNKNYAHNTHTCETTQLLKELKDEPVCLCHLNETNLNEAPNENEINKLLQKSGKKKSKRSKQLFIYNEKGCLKSIEVNKETNSVLHGLINCPPTKETLFATEDYISTNDSGQSADSALERSISLNCQPSEYVTNSDTREILNVPIIPQSYTNNTVEETVRKRKKRKGLKKKQSKKSKHIGNTSSINKKTQNDEEHSLPCAVVQEQSFTQFSVEEVHVAESSESVERPRRNRKWKSASEMLMLKRRIRKRIVQSTTSIKIQRREFKKQYCSNMESDLSLVCNSEERKKAIEQNNEKGLYKYRYRGCSKELEKYGPELLPPGWNLNVTKRKSGKTAGQLDIYFINPDGKRIRSKVELASYIKENGLPYSPEEFCFRKSAYKMIENSSV